MDVKYGFTSLVKTGVPNRLPELFTDEQLYSINKERFNFYQQLLDELSNQGTKIPDTVFGIANRNRYVIEKLRDDMNSLANSISVLRARVSEKDPSAMNTHLKRMEDRLNAQLKSNIFLKDYQFVHTPESAASSANGATAQKGGTKPDEAAGSSGQPAPAGAAPTPSETTKLSRTTDEVAALNRAFEKAKNNTTDPDALAQFRVRYENDPIMAPSVDEITSTDRVIFIAVTFLFRGVALFLTEWAMNSYMFTGFQAAISWYCGVYISLILLLALLVNASKDIQLFRMMFYYLSFIPHGFGRLVLHCVVLLMLLPIPFLVREGMAGVASQESEDYTFARRRSIMRVLSNLTFFIWALTSIIAARF